MLSRFCTLCLKMELECKLWCTEIRNLCSACEIALIRRALWPLYDHNFELQSSLNSFQWLVSHSFLLAVDRFLARIFALQNLTNCIWIISNSGMVTWAGSLNGPHEMKKQESVYPISHFAHQFLACTVKCVMIVSNHCFGKQFYFWAPLASVFLHIYLVSMIDIVKYRTNIVL